MSKTVIINHNGQQQQLQLPQGRTQHLRFNPQAHYRFLDEQQQPIEAIKIEQKGDSLWFYLPEQAEPILILDDASQFTPIFHLDNPLYLPPAAASGTAESTLLATAVSTPTSGNAWKVGLGALALLGAGAAIAGSSSSNEEAEPAQPSTPPTPPSNIDTTAPVLTLSVQPLANINSHNINQLHSLSGTISGNEILHNVQIKVLINGVEKTAAVSGNTWSLELSGAELAQQQGSQNLQITATAHDAAGNIAHAQTSATYQVDTQIDTPQIHFNSITDDNIINLAESQTAVQISGSVQHFHAGDKLSVAIGQASPILVDIQTDGSFQFMVDGRTLAAHAEIHASLTTQDSAGNHATASAQANYAVDIIPPIPSITLNQITDDNIINKTESEKPTTSISGKVSGLENNNQVVLICACSSCSSPIYEEIYVPIQSDNTFSIDITTTDLLKYNSITAKLTTQDNAKNQSEASDKQNYRQDLLINPPEITIDQIQNINRSKWLQNDFIITGTLKFDTDVIDKQAKIKVILNDQEFIPEHNGKTWSIAISQNQLQQWNKQTVNVSAEIYIQDQAGNTSTTTTQNANFKVEIDLPALTIDLNPIGKIDPTQDLKITGKVLGQFNSIDTVSAQIGSHRIDNIAIQTDGIFNTTISKNYLTGQNAISVSVNTSDTFGNISSATDRENFSILTNQDIVINFNKITSDDIINVSEKLQEIKISGYLTGNDAAAQKGKFVSMNVNEKILTTKVQDDLTFYFNVTGKDLVKHSNFELTASLNDSGRIISATKNYTVDANTVAEIYLNDININLAEDLGSFRLSGKLDFTDSLFNAGYNKDFIRAIILKIGNQEFNIGVKQTENTFILDLTEEQYNHLKGSEITYELIAYNDSYHNMLPITKDHSSNQKEIYFSEIKNPEIQEELKKIKLIFDNKAIEETKQLQGNIDKLTEISGNVKGAQSGDEITVQVGSKTYRTKVKNDFTFSIKVENKYLDEIKNISANLKTKNSKGEEIRVDDTANVLQGIKVSDAFINPHQKIEYHNQTIQHSDIKYNFPYFIHAMDTRSTFGLLDYKKTPFGGDWNKTPIIKYYFATQQDYNNGLRSKYNGTLHDTYKEYSNELKEEIHKVYREIENIANLKFVEVQNKEDADTIFTTASFNSNSSGFAFFGGDVILNSDYSEVNIFKKYINFHEILHTLGATHIDANPSDKFNSLAYAQAEKTTETTVMSYKYHNFTNHSGRYNFSLYDLAYLHYRFGINQNHNIGNDVYSFNNYNPTVSDGNLYIWDGGGVDTFDASQEKEGVTVNLTPGSWIYRGAISDSFLIQSKQQISYKDYFSEFSGTNFFGILFNHTKNIYTEGQAFIGYGTQIENLIGSDHNDVLTGNKAANNIFGGDGNDKIDGGEGDDYLDGGKGADIMLGGLGDDIFVVDNNNDQIIENTAEGNDTVYAFLDYSLPNNVENIHLFGTANQATGNELNNIITGNDHNNILLGGAGNDTLNGGRGSDTVTGDSGTDTFVFNSLLDGSIDTITDFEIGIDKIQLASNIFTHLTNNNLSEYLQYNQNTGALFYDPDGKGNMDSIHFATLQNRPDLAIDINHFILG